jgi:hypothetical protein
MMREPEGKSHSQDKELDAYIIFKLILEISLGGKENEKKQIRWLLVRKRNIPTERRTPVGEF